jgi:hypothetical protein
MTVSMFRAVSAIIDSIRQARSHKHIIQQFVSKGFSQLDCPTILEMLPLRDAGMVREDSNCLFEKGDTQVLVFSTTWTPRSRTPGRRQTFTLLCLPLGDDPVITRISAAIREPAELYSVVDQLDLESYPSLSPLPDYTIFAADAFSARQMLDIGRERRAKPGKADQGQPAMQAGSLVVHKGRLMMQMSG